MLKVTIDGAKVEITCRFARQGSVLRGTVEARGEGVDVRVKVDSPDPADRVARVVRNAEAGCYVIQTIRHPTPTSTTLEVNGKAVPLPE